MPAVRAGDDGIVPARQASISRVAVPRDCASGSTDAVAGFLAPGLTTQILSAVRPFRSDSAQTWMRTPTQAASMPSLFVARHVDTAAQTIVSARVRYLPSYSETQRNALSRSSSTWPTRLLTRLFGRAEGVNSLRTSTFGRNVNASQLAVSLARCANLA